MASLPLKLAIFFFISDKFFRGNWPEIFGAFFLVNYSIDERHLLLQVSLLCFIPLGVLTNGGDLYFMNLTNFFHVVGYGV